MKQLFIFTFYIYTDYNIRFAKISLFILFVSFFFAFTALFFNDNIMRQIYIYKGNTDAAVHIPNIIFSSLFCLIMNFIVRYVSLSERDITKINYESDFENKIKFKKILKMQLIILFAISGTLITLCWYMLLLSLLYSRILKSIILLMFFFLYFLLYLSLCNKFNSSCFQTPRIKEKISLNA